MPRRAASVTQADIARAIRAVKAEGLPVLRVIVRADGVAVETTGESVASQLADKGRVVVL
ncbi:hypothetical protein [Methylobacterium gnaphalii]|uniref:Uncharacterized protein n=1 Tax=Methylobacterium gnaphalii TaxID=1010610 RepID=A0A512JF48_9HYPH|nr:hypothetical protein [Methylobacterium gnaphalii]GEP08571.1 hypothetical protein MGN01_04160 [Methylobacterium gnaphalii]GJD70593.1 hypothetical protein MMMDOFMJ_3542 [Methylobacterium gnaphalii]GLS50788.1 hypothetical protein GCM10007885_36420 [Methylobacterium gnaphalii]